MNLNSSKVPEPTTIRVVLLISTVARIAIRVLDRVRRVRGTARTRSPKPTPRLVVSYSISD